MRIVSLFLPLLLGSLPYASCGRETAEDAPSPAPVPVSLLTARFEDFPAVIEAPGSVQPRNRIVLSSQVNGFVRDVRIRAGDTAAAGQILVTLDAREAESQRDAARASIEEARAALEEARKSAQMAESMRAAARASSELANGTFARYQKLYETRSVSPQELDEVRARRDASAAELAAKEMMVTAAQDRIRQVEARIGQADAQARRAEVLMSWTVVTAPSAGTIVERSVDPGSAIFPGSPLLVMESSARPQILADLPTAQARHLQLGMEVVIRGSENASGPFKGRVAEIVPISHHAAHTVQFKVDTPPDFSAFTGDFARVEIPSGTRPAMLVPMQAVRRSGQLEGIFVVDGSSKARFRLVKTAPFDESRVEILAGLEQGERLITSVTAAIADGISVEIQP